MPSRCGNAHSPLYACSQPYEYPPFSARHFDQGQSSRENDVDHKLPHVAVAASKLQAKATRQGDAEAPAYDFVQAAAISAAMSGRPRLRRISCRSRRTKIGELIACKMRLRRLAIEKI